MGSVKEIGGIRLETPLSETPGIPPGFLKKLQKLGLKTIRDLLWHFPVRYEDFSEIYNISDVAAGPTVTIRGEVGDAEMRRAWRRRMTIVEATIQADSGAIKAVWFNQPYILQTLKPGRLANFSGKVAFSNGELCLSHPAYEILSKSFADNENPETKHTGRLVPVYPETHGLTSRGLRFLIKPILETVLLSAEWIPEGVIKTNNFPRLPEALQSIHFPDALEDALRARQRFSFESLFLLQLYNAEQKIELSREKAPRISTDIEKLKIFLGALPFQLTFSQKKALWEIVKDLEKSNPMNRLLQGDVGSGKTVVAALAAFAAAESGYQTAFMAPTEVLAHQHYATFKKLIGQFKLFGKVSVGIITGGGSKALYDENLEGDVQKKKFAEGSRSGQIHIVLGTHALISGSKKSAKSTTSGLSFKNLGLVVIDEQHRFGVRQRALLARGQPQNETPTDASSQHFLSMSATPIPRTLMLTIFGDLDISLITELPAGRKAIETKIVPPAERDRAYAFIRAEVKAGRQVFVICPRIEQEVDADAKSGSAWNAWNGVKSVKEEYEKLSTKVFSDLKVGMLHGQLPSPEKKRVMENFSKGMVDILISTSVVEVGVDVPNATIMMIEGSERFGLAQLYQFRGRVGRGEHQSHCFLFTDSEGKAIRDRLQAVVEAKNGLELAEKDLKFRGPGEFLGEAQTGFPDAAMSALKNIETEKASREAAMGILKSDPTLKKYPELARKLEEFKRTIHQE